MLFGSEHLTHVDELVLHVTHYLSQNAQTGILLS